MSSLAFVQAPLSIQPRSIRTQQKDYISSLQSSSFVISTRSFAKIVSHNSKRHQNGSLTIRMGKVAAFGPFTPIVVAARLVIGEKRFNKLRGTGIALHSQAITNFCDYVGANPKTRQGLIKLAKTNGNTLGFLS